MDSMLPSHVALGSNLLCSTYCVPELIKNLVSEFDKQKLKEAHDCACVYAYVYMQVGECLPLSLSLTNSE